MKSDILKGDILNFDQVNNLLNLGLDFKDNYCIYLYRI